MLPEEARIQALRLLKQYPYPGAEVEGIMELFNSGYRMEFEHDQTICAEGEPATCMYVLTYGKVGVLKKDFGGRTRRVATMHSPSIFGHMSMVDGSNRSATCVAEGVVAVVVIDRATYQRLITSPQAVGRTLRRMLLASLTDQLSRGNSRIRELTGGPAAAHPPGAAPEVAAAAQREVTEEDLSEISSELEGWRQRALTDEDPTDVYSANDANGPVVDEPGR